VKVQCERCKEIVLFEFAVTPAGVDVSCGACGERYHVPETAGAAPSVPLPTGEMLCPKCAEAQPPAAACRRCGLVQAKWRGLEQAPELSMGIDAEVNLEAAREPSLRWEACLARWDDATAHEAFLAACQQAGSFAFAAARYRSALQDRGGHDPVAESRLKQVRSLAEFALLRPTRATDPAGAAEASPYRNTVIVLTLGVALIAAGFVYLLVSHH
jgi:hypothetical protein